MPKTLRGRLALVVAVAALTASTLPIAASATSLANEVEQGQRLSESLNSGGRRCSDLSADEFELIGEYAMASYLGDEAAHEAMNRRMTSVMGEAGERRMHIALGYRYSGCPGGPASGWVGPMAGMMGGGVGGSGGYRPGMMGEGESEGRGDHSGTMMGSSDQNGTGISTLGVVLIALAAAALGAGIVALAVQRRAPGAG